MGDCVSDRVYEPGEGAGGGSFHLSLQIDLHTTL